MGPIILRTAHTDGLWRGGWGKGSQKKTMKEAEVTPLMLVASFRGVNVPCKGRDPDCKESRGSKWKPTVGPKTVVDVQPSIAYM